MKLWNTKCKQFGVHSRMREGKKNIMWKRENAIGLLKINDEMDRKNWEIDNECKLLGSIGFG